MRATAHFRPSNLHPTATASRLRRRALGLTRRLVDLALGHPTSGSDVEAGLLTAKPAPSRRRSVLRRQLLIRLTSERTVPLAVALVVLVAGGISLGPSMVRPVGAAQENLQPVRLAVGGGTVPITYGPASVADRQDMNAANATNVGQYVDDGTLYKPVAVDTSVQSSADLLRYYTAKSGDTLASIAKRFHVATTTIWWANHFTTSDRLHSGQVLVVPPVNGLVITVKSGDTIKALATKFSVDPQAIVSVNKLTDTHLILGQVLIIPGAQGAPMPNLNANVKASNGPIHGSFNYTAGPWLWPVSGGANYISQTFWSGHLGVDIAAHEGTPIVAARPGRVIFAGWQNNGGGNQVWLSIGDGMYICMYHMSAVLVKTGQVVARGQEVGRIGMTGWATGPHVHFEVWIGYPWDSSSYRVNPLKYI